MAWLCGGRLRLPFHSSVSLLRLTPPSPPQPLRSDCLFTPSGLRKPGLAPGPARIAGAGAEAEVEVPW